MNINKENLLKKSYNDFEVICNFIGLSILKNFFLSECKNSMKTCKYYIGKINGKYWNGFRPSTISLKKICEVLFLEKSGSEINVEKIIDNSIKEKLNIKNDENLEKEIKEINDYNVLLILSNIYDIANINENELKIKFERLEIENKIAKYEDEIKEKDEIIAKNLEIINKNEAKQSNLSDKVNKLQQTLVQKEKELTQLKEDYNLIKDISKKEIQKANENNLIKMNELKKSYEELMKENEINKNIKFELCNKLIQTNFSKEDIKEIIEKEEIVEKKDLFEFVERLLNLNIKNFKEKNNISKLLVLEYVLLKIMEE